MVEDFVPFAGMLLALLLAVVAGGVVLLYPLTRRLGRLLELRIEERTDLLAPGGKAGGMAGSEEVARLAATVASLEEEVARLAERQQFTERLLEAGERRTSAQ